MKTIVTYKISSRISKATYIKEYWDDVHVYTWRVDKTYNGGDIVEFLQQNSAYRQVQFDGLDEFHRRTFILDL